MDTNKKYVPSAKNATYKNIFVFLPLPWGRVPKGPQNIGRVIYRVLQLTMKVRTSSGSG
jgi:hypothetical protein